METRRRADRDSPNVFWLGRGIGVVVIEDIPPECADSMTQLLTGFGAVSPLPKMCDALERHASDIYVCEHDLEMACYAVETGDAELFRQSRSAIVRSLTKHVEAMTRQIYRHDPDCKASDGEVSDDKSEEELVITRYSVFSWRKCGYMESRDWIFCATQAKTS